MQNRSEQPDHDEILPEPRFNGSIGRTLIIAFLFVSLVPLAVLSYLSASNNEKVLNELALAELGHASTLVQRSFHRWFDYRLQDLDYLGASSNVLVLLDSLKQGWRTSGQSLDIYTRSADWRRTSQQHPELIQAQKTYDYIYDILLMDRDGNILFSLALETDLGTNLFNGPYAQTRFAAAVRNSLASGTPQLSDVEPYAPSQGVESGFFIRPMTSQSGGIEGLIAVQFRIDLMKRQFSVPSTFESRHYVIGADSAQRISLVQAENAVNQSNVPKAYLDADVLRSGDDSTVPRPFHFTGYFGSPVIGVITPIDLFGVSWYLISEMDEERILAKSSELLRIGLPVILFAVLVASLLGLWMVRRIATPIRTLADATMLAAAGELDTQVDIKSRDEVGRLAKAFNHMLVMRQIHEQALTQSQQENEAALLQLRELNQALDEHAIVAVTDVRGAITLVNTLFVTISGFSKDELIGQNHRILNSGHHSVEFWRDMYLTVSQGRVWNDDVCNRAKGGALYWVNTTIMPFMRGGKPHGYISIRTDITERVAFQRDLIRARDDAQQGAKAKAEFLASMSHEIRTPMNGVIGMLSLLAQGTLSQQQGHYVDLARSSAESLLMLLNDILDFSKIDAGHLELEMIDFNVTAMFSDVAESMALRAQEKGLELILDLSDVKCSVVKGDPGRIRQVLTNLVGNAIKFTHQGEVLIQAGTQFDADGQCGRLSCVVKDTGIGIASEKLDHIFEAFTQEDASTTRKYGGTGLGLAIARQLVIRMGGDLLVASQIGQGSEFSFSIDLAPADKLVQPLLPKLDVKDVPILVVDDNSTNRLVLKAQLELWGARVWTADSAYKALELLDHHSAELPEAPAFNVAYVDLQMPGMDGAELGRRIRKDSRLSELKLIVMTSMASRGDAQFFSNLGFNAYFPKPATISDLYDSLALVLCEIGASDSSMPLVTRHYLRGLERADSANVDFRQAGKILLVEDNEVNQLVAQSLLTTFGLNSDLVSNGQQAIRRLLETDAHYALILMDCQMPVMDGYQATERIRLGDAGERYQRVTIVAMTANAMKGDREKCLAAGMDDYVTKPIDSAVLQAALARWLLPQRPLSDNEATTETMDEPATVAELPIWNRQALLQRLMGNDDILQRVVTAYRSSMPGLIDELERALRDGALDEAARHVHTIKGSSANVGADILAQHALQLELLLKEAPLSEARAVFATLRHHYRELELLIQR